LNTAKSFCIGVVKSVDIVTILRDLSSCITAFHEHAVEGLWVSSVARPPKSDTNNGDWLVHGGSSVVEDTNEEWWAIGKVNSRVT
jgi:hypothetical protein